MKELLKAVDVLLLSYREWARFFRLSSGHSDPELAKGKNPGIFLVAPIHSRAMPRFTQAYVYILANAQRRLYIGVTTRLA